MSLAVEPGAPDSELKKRVSSFWESQPLFTGESRFEPGTLEFVQEHEAVYKQDVFAGQELPERLFPFVRGGKVLEVGCGPGYWTRQIARRGYDVTAVDLTFSGLKLAKSSLDLMGLKAKLVKGDAECLPFADESFDGVFSLGVIHHTPDTEGCIKEFSRLAKPGGKLVVSVYYRNVLLRSPRLMKLISGIFGRIVGLKGRGRERMLESGDPNEIVRIYDGADNPLGKSYTRSEFLAMFEACDLSPEATFRYFFPLRAFGRFAWLLSPIKRLLCNRFGLLITVVATKKSSAQST